MPEKQGRVGFVSTRFAGTDGVSLETAKWVQALIKLGHETFFFAGVSDWAAERSYIVAEAHFNHPDIQMIQADLFGDYVRTTQTSQQVQKIKDHLKAHLAQFIQKFDLNILIVENALALPMNIPLGLALTEVIAESGIAVIAHHHDFSWERQRYAVGAANDYVRAAFPPVLPSVSHVVINSVAAHQLAMRTGERSTLVPNVMDFEVPPPTPDDYTAEFRKELAIAPEEHLLLQPTRVVPRKRIETAIELARRLQLPCVLVVTHASGDEGGDYLAYLQEYAQLMGVRVLFIPDRVAPQRGLTADGRKVFSLADAYAQADLVTYPSAVEGFGNAFLEAVYFRRPIILRDYEIFIEDIEPKGFEVITFGDFIPSSVVEQTRQLMLNPASADAMCARNYEIARRYYAYSVLEDHLKVLMNQGLGT